MKIKYFYQEFAPSLSVYVPIVSEAVCRNPFGTCGNIDGTLANSVDPGQTPQNAVSDQGLHYLHLGQEFL